MWRCARATRELQCIALRSFDISMLVNLWPCFASGTWKQWILHGALMNIFHGHCEMKINHLYVHLQRHETIWWEDVAVNGISVYVQYWIKLQSFESTPTRPLGSASAQNFCHFRLAPRFRFRHLSSTFSSSLQLSSMALNRTTWRDEVTRLDAEVLTLKGILSTSNYSEVAEQQFSFHNPRGYAGPMAAASRQSRLPPGFWLVPRFLHLHDSFGVLQQEHAQLMTRVSTLENENQALKAQLQLLWGHVMPPQPRTPDTTTRSRSRTPTRRYLPGHAPSRAGPHGPTI